MIYFAWFVAYSLVAISGLLLGYNYLPFNPYGPIFVFINMHALIFGWLAIFLATN